MDKETIFVLLVIVVLGVLSIGTPFDWVIVSFITIFPLLIFYNLTSLNEVSLFYIFSKSNKYFSSKMIEILFKIFFGITLAFISLPVSMILFNAIISTYNYLSLPELPNLDGLFIISIIISLIAIIFDILFLKMLKMLFLKPVKIEDGGI